MKRRLCSYDMVEATQHAFVLTDSGGEMYFCDLRCLCVWSVQLATRPNLSELQRSGTYLLKTVHRTKVALSAKPVLSLRPQLLLRCTLRSSGMKLTEAEKTFS